MNRDNDPTGCFLLVGLGGAAFVVLWIVLLSGGFGPSLKDRCELACDSRSPASIVSEWDGDTRTCICSDRSVFRIQSRAIPLRRP